MIIMIIICVMMIIVNMIITYSITRYTNTHNTCVHIYIYIYIYNVPYRYAVYIAQHNVLYHDTLYYVLDGKRHRRKRAGPMKVLAALALATQAGAVRA